MKVCVITGGGSGMGLEAARAMPNDRVFLLSGRTQSKLEKAAEQLKAEGKQAYVMTCDTSDRRQVHELQHYGVRHNNTILYWNVTASLSYRKHKVSIML